MSGNLFLKKTHNQWGREKDYSTLLKIKNRIRRMK